MKVKALRVGTKVKIIKSSVKKAIGKTGEIVEKRGGFFGGTDYNVFVGDFYIWQRLEDLEVVKK